MDADLAEAGGDRDRLVRDDPDAPWVAIHLHRKAGGGIERPDPLALQRIGDRMRDIVDVMIAAVELEVADRAHGCADVLAMQACDDRDEGPRPGERRQRMRAFGGDLLAVDRDEADVRGAGLAADAAQAVGGDGGRRGARRAVAQGADGRVIARGCHDTRYNTCIYRYQSTCICPQLSARLRDICREARTRIMRCRRGRTEPLVTKLMLEAIEAVRTLPDEQQDDIARAVLRLAGQGAHAVYALTPEEHADLDEADREIERGDFLSGDELKAIWAKRGL